jgi:N6-adenosine-specific RNA methylase IME4
MGSNNRSIECHYPTLSLDEICALPVGDLATDDAMLYLWATAPKLAECIKVIEAWGFDYRTHIMWDKEIIGMGYYARNQHELLLIARRGAIPPPEAGKQPSSVYRERRGAHSAKPLFFYEMIEASYPGLPRIEIFARGAPRAGWDAWGNEASVEGSNFHTPAPSE